MTKDQAETWIEILSILFFVIFSLLAGTEVIESIGLVVGGSVTFVVALIGFTVLEKL